MTVALAVPVLVLAPTLGGFYELWVGATAEISYTLYLAHFPFLTLIVMNGIAPHRFQPGWSGAVVHIGLMVCAMGWAAGVWWCFERNTDHVFQTPTGAGA